MPFFEGMRYVSNVKMAYSVSLERLILSKPGLKLICHPSSIERQVEVACL